MNERFFAFFSLLLSLSLSISISLSPSSRCASCALGTQRRLLRMPYMLRRRDASFASFGCIVMGLESIKLENVGIVAAVIRASLLRCNVFRGCKTRCSAATRRECPGDRRKDLPVAFTVTISLTGCDWRENTTEGTRQFLSRFPDRPRSGFQQSTQP